MIALLVFGLFAATTYCLLRTLTALRLLGDPR